MFRTYSTRGLIIFWIGILRVALRVAPASAAQPQPDKRPNILFIAIDDLRPELGCYGGHAIKSPHINRLAQTGVTFTRAYCQVALCNPSRASLLTGLRPDTIRVWDLPTHFRTRRPDAVTLPQCFGAQGYTTVAIGKIHHHNLLDPKSWNVPKLDEPNADRRKMFYPGVQYLDPQTQTRVDQIFQGLLDAGKTPR